MGYLYEAIFIHIEHICSFFVAFFSATIDGRNLIFGHKLHIGVHEIVFSLSRIIVMFVDLLSFSFMKSIAHSLR
jgi:hypothetical protein